ncbi:iduronate 2-sulfatase [Toxorhynchites rutilus septentrionalis]|uniref:iduronate 2-sulfatase n=1 Tax=Toxorhynchites rutilus septentrionalis TaxID=329112 RepID=UPI00247AB8CD|nr:iduronate 2-sulfatase [Toxorhynchites rutilus septentrionalis]
MKLVYFVLFSVLSRATSLIIKRPNVLLIMLDDLRPAINAFGDPKAITPNIDKLIKKGYYFTNVFAQQSICAPSRNSLLTGRRPDTIRLYDFYSYWREFASNFTTIPQYFKQNGYITHSIGKIFHPGVSSNYTDDYPLSWSNVPYHPSTEKYMNEPVCIDIPTGKLKKNLLCPVDLELQPENTLPDIQSTLAAKDFLQQRQNKTREPFLLAVGYHKPHIPFKFPSKYLKMHRTSKFRNQDPDYPPYGLPTVAWNSYLDVRSRDDVIALNISYPFGPIRDEMKLKIRQHYYAAVTYVDDLIGQLFEDVDFSNTIVILTSDHGWSLGEHAEWSKFSNYDVALKVPLIVYSPDIKTVPNNKIDKVVELLDIFPTLVDIAGLPPVTSCRDRIKAETCVEGKSLLSYITDPTCNDHPEEAFSQYPRPGTYPSVHPNSDKPKLYQITIMGYSIRTKQYRYTAWIGFDPSKFTRDWTKLYGEELYDHSIDPNENMNLAERPQLLEIKEHLNLRLQMKFC